MILTVAVLVSFALTLVCARWASRASSWEMVPIMLTIVLGAFTLIAPLVGIVNQLFAYGEIAQIEQVRAAQRQADPTAFRDIYARVVSANETIGSNHTYRRLWWSREFVAPAWDTVATIPLERPAP